MTDQAPSRRRRVPYPAVDGDKLWDMRRRKGLQLKDLSALSENSISFICDLEHGRRNPHPDRLSRLAKALGCSVADLLADRPA